MLFTSSSKSLTNENFEYLIKNCPTNSLKEVLKSLIFFFDVKEKNDFTSKVLTDFHHNQKTLIFSPQKELILCEQNVIGKKLEFVYFYLDFEYDLIGRKVTPKLFEVDVFDVSIAARKEPTPAQINAFQIPPNIFNRLEFFKLWKEKFCNENLQSSFFGRMTSPNQFILIGKLKIVDGKTFVKKIDRNLS